MLLFGEGRGKFKNDTPAIPGLVYFPRKLTTWHKLLCLNLDPRRSGGGP